MGAVIGWDGNLGGAGVKKTLVIVESPAKAKTIEKFLGRKYQVKASLGHVRDLPKSQLGIDIEQGFEPKYITIRGKGEILKELRDAAAKAKDVLLATDPDREGEAISWHLAHALKLDMNKPCRIRFHEITKPAVQAAMEHQEIIDRPLVDAQQARRILDRLVGYRLSPLLWRKVKKGLSAGRVQSVAVRIICDREDEIDSFEQQEYWTLHGSFQSTNENGLFDAQLIEYNGKKIDVSNGDEARDLANRMRSEIYSVSSVKKRERRRFPAPSFTTSTFQQEASRKLNFGVRKSMMLAQQLYEGVELGKEGRVGLITYMRTDSTRVSDLAVQSARQVLLSRFGKEYLGSIGKKKSNQDQEGAHEAIRPTYPDKTPDQMKEYLSRDQLRVYRLIWDRFMASQMAPAVFDTVTVLIQGGPFLMRASGSQIRFAGFTALYVEGTDEDEKDESTLLPEVAERQELKLDQVEPIQHFTQPPPRYSEATLIKTMEENGIGRPSTYAPTIDTIRQRGYVFLEEKRFYVSELGRIVNDILIANFGEIMNVEFTAKMESDLDRVEEGKMGWQQVVGLFYQDFETALVKAEQNIEEIEIEDEVSDVVCEKCGRMMVIKWGRFGKFLACPGFPECRNTKSFLKETGTDCPLCGGAVVERISKKGRKFYGCENFPECDFISWDKPVDKNCPECGAYMVEKNTKRRGTFYRCSSKECGHEETFDDENENGVTS